MPEAWAQLAEASIHRVLVPANIVGMAVLVRPVAAVINTLVQGQDTPVVQVPPAEDIILNVIVNPLTLGAVALVSVIVRMLMLVRARATPVAPAPPAAENIPPAPVPAAMNGKTEVARNKFSTVPKVICIIVTVQWLVLRLAIWASMLR